MTKEPSVLDYVLAKLMPWRGPAPEIPSVSREEAPLVSAAASAAEIIPPVEAAAQEGLSPARAPAPEPTALAPRSLPWRSLLALGLALAAQLSLEPSPGRAWTSGLVLYLVAAALLAWAVWRGEWSTPLRPDEPRQDPLTFRLRSLGLALLVSAVAFWALGGNLFTRANVGLWLLAVALTLGAFWLGQASLLHPSAWIDGLKRLLGALQRPEWNLRVSPWALLWLGVFALAVYFRASQMVEVPPQMNSDHAEKLLDVYDVLQGQTHIFFPRNTGREAFQFYLIALTIKLLGTGLTFTSMKIGAILCGLLTLPYIYLLGKEIANKEVGLLAMAFTGIAYWPNVLARVALRFTLYPLFVAPTLYYLLRGLRTSNRNDFLLAGLALGVGLHTYTPIRALPLAVLAAVGLYLLHRRGVRFASQRTQAQVGLALLAMVSLVLFLPLLRFMFEDPGLFFLRTFTRMGSLEQPLPAPALLIFIQNLWNAFLMYGWNDGQIWVISVSGRPALDVVSAALFYLGVVFLFVRYLKQRHWLDLFLLSSVPLLMLPSILALAFPAENPAPNRAAGAVVPVFLIIAITLYGFLQALKTVGGGKLGVFLARGTLILLFGLACLQNYTLVFDEYRRGYQLSSWNTSEMGQVIRDFADTFGKAENAWVVAYPHWVDTRLVGINAGYPTRDFAISLDRLAETQQNPEAKLFLVKFEDEQSLNTLKLLYPSGWSQLYQSKVETKDFWVFFVPPLWGTLQPTGSAEPVETSETTESPAEPLPLVVETNPLPYPPPAENGPVDAAPVESGEQYPH